MVKKLLSARWLLTHLVVVIGVIILINLGFWQLRRLEQRRALNSEIEAGLSRPAVTLTGQAVEPDELHLRRVVVTGTFDNEQGVLIRNRPLNGRPGMHLVVPLRIAGSDRAVLIDRGWIPLQAPDPAVQRSFDVTGQVTVAGIARRAQTRPEGFLMPTDPTPAPGERLDIWFRIDVARIQTQLPYPLLPIFVEQSPDPAVAPNEPPIPDQVIDLGEGSHLGYAIQWFSFAAILLVTYGAFVWQELKKG